MITIDAEYRGSNNPIVLTPSDQTGLVGNQPEMLMRGGLKSEPFNSPFTHVFETGYKFELPNYQHRALTRDGWTYGVIGYTTYDHTVWGAKRS